MFDTLQPGSDPGSVMLNPGEPDPRPAPAPASRPSSRPGLPPWYGERLDLDYAIHVCLANARTEQERQTRLQDGEAEARDRVTVYEPEDWDKQIRRYYDEHPRGLYCVAQSISG